MTEYIAYKTDEGYIVAECSTNEVRKLVTKKDVEDYVLAHRFTMVNNLEDLGNYDTTYVRIWNDYLNKLGFYI